MMVLFQSLSDIRNLKCGKVAVWGFILKEKFGIENKKRLENEGDFGGGLGERRNGRTGLFGCRGNLGGGGKFGGGMR